VVIDKKASKLVVHTGNATPGAPLRFLRDGVYRRRNGLKCARFNQLSRSMKILRFEAGKLSETKYNQKDAA
jgi:phospholipase/carboxylesterase